jgi:hypothetical protein
VQGLRGPGSGIPAQDQARGLHPAGIQSGSISQLSSGSAGQQSSPPTQRSPTYNTSTQTQAQTGAQRQPSNAGQFVCKTENYQCAVQKRGLCQCETADGSRETGKTTDLIR